MATAAEATAEAAEVEGTAAAAVGEVMEGKVTGGAAAMVATTEV